MAEAQSSTMRKEMNSNLRNIHYAQGRRHQVDGHCTTSSQLQACALADCVVLLQRDKQGMPRLCATSLLVAGAFGPHGAGTINTKAATLPAAFRSLPFCKQVCANIVPCMQPAWLSVARPGGSGGVPHYDYGQL